MTQFRKNMRSIKNMNLETNCPIHNSKDIWTWLTPTRDLIFREILSLKWGQLSSMSSRLTLMSWTGRDGSAILKFLVLISWLTRNLSLGLSKSTLTLAWRSTVLFLHESYLQWSKIPLGWALILCFRLATTIQETKDLASVIISSEI